MQYPHIPMEYPAHSTAIATAPTVSAARRPGATGPCPPLARARTSPTSSRRSAPPRRRAITPIRTAAWSAPSFTYFISVPARSDANSSVVCGLELVAPKTVYVRSAATPNAMASSVPRLATGPAGRVAAVALAVLRERGGGLLQEGAHLVQLRPGRAGVGDLVVGQVPLRLHHQRGRRGAAWLRNSSTGAAWLRGLARRRRRIRRGVGGAGVCGGPALAAPGAGP